ncbi:MAG: hypothetical protein ICV75_01970 [Nitrospiraceae bacterium]|nr:hypothetical protein [Nitrospiraceae bacterium]
MSVALPLALLIWLQPQSGAACPADDSKAALSVSEEQSPGMAEPESPEMRASIVDRDGDQFIAKTETGDEFRLPVEGAPPDTSVGDVLRLVPDPDSQTMNVFKADPADDRQEENPSSQL